MPAEILRSPVPVTGAVEGLLCRGTPVINAHGQRAVIVEAENPDPARLHELSRIRIDWSSPTALDIAIRWLMDRGHDAAWMRPLRYGGRVPAWDGLTEDEVAAILVSVSVRFQLSFNETGKANAGIEVKIMIKNVMRRYKLLMNSISCSCRSGIV